MRPVPPIPPKNSPVFSDQDTTVESLKDLVRGFISEREWAPYHTPKNVAASVAIEAAELLEHFQWEHPTPAELSKTKRGEIADEMADVLAYLLSLANVLNIDLAASLQQKMGKNRRKYPADRFRGRWEKVRS
ncbi:MAG TPA: nucleotide pyrophosphohydrolase [Candidatus Ozemobacteraceae bacterium]|nr:nucleotide pyrophosphohydrolase [Candidatus Ozemobacteraceae bacterium]